MANTKNRFISGLLSFLMMLTVVIGALPPIEVKAATPELETPKITSPSISRSWNSNGFYTGKRTSAVDCSEGLELEWTDVGADYYDISMIILSGDPNPGTSESRVYQILTSEDVYDTYLYIDAEEFEDYPEYWVKIAIQPMLEGGNSSNGGYGYMGMYYFMIDKFDENFQLSEEYIEFDADGGKDTFYVYADSSYTLEVTEGEDWLSLSSSSGSADNKITITCDENTSVDAREGEIEVYHKSSGDYLYVDIWQDGYDLEPSSSFPNKTETMVIGQTYEFTGTATAEGADIDIVHVDIQGPDVQTVGVSYYRETDIADDTYDYSDIDSFVWGDTLKSYVNSTTMSTDEPGKYWIIVYTKDEYGGTSIRTHIVNLRYPEQVLDTPALNIPEISSTWSSNGYYTGQYSGTIPCNEDVELEWDDVDADYYALNMIVLSGSPNPASSSESRVHEIELNYHTTKTNYTIDAADLEDYAGKWVKVSIQPMLDNGDYGYRGLYYFKLAKGEPVFTFDADVSDEISLGESITWSGSVTTDTDAIDNVSVCIMKGESDGIYYRTTSVGKYSYDLANLNSGSMITGKTAPSGWAPLDGDGNWKVYDSFIIDEPGTYYVQFAASTKEGYYDVSEPFAVVVESNTFEIKSIMPSSDSVETQEGVDFTITTNSAAKYGVDIYAGEYYLARVDNGTRNGNQIVYSYEGHKFTSSGTKTIYAYPLTSSKTPDKSISATCEITVNAPYGRIGNPVFTTANNQTIGVNESFSLSWKNPSAPSSGITYNMYMMKSGTTDNQLIKGGLTGRSYSIPASFFKNEGQYIITLYALASGYAQNATGATLVVNVKNDDSIYVMSVTPSTSDTKTLIDVDFSIKASTSAKYGVAIYAGKYHLATVKNKTTYSKYIKYVYENHNFTSSGVKNIYVYPLDANDNIIQDEGAYATCSIQVAATGACGSPTITTADNKTINLDTDFSVAWKKPSVPSSGLKYNVYVRHSYNEDGEPLDNADTCVNSSMLTATSLTIDGSYFTEKGSYTITVYAMASGYTQSKPAAITVYVTDGYRLQVNAKELTAYEGGGKGNNITVTANIGWSVSSDVNWISFNTSNGTGNGQFYPIIDANDSAEERSGNIIVSGGGITRKILVKQGGVLINTSAQEDSVYNQPTSQLRVTVKEISAILKRTVLVSNATVTYGNTTVKTDKDGIAVIPYDVQSGNSLVVSKSGYSTQTIAAKWLSVNQGAIDVTLNPLNDKNEPTINAVWVLGSNILKESYAVDLLSPHSISFTADVDWGNDSYGSISLWQNGKQVMFTGDNLQTVLSEKFDVSQTIYIVVINASGKETREKLKFDVSGGYPEWLDKADLNFTDSFSFELPKNIPLLGGKKMEVNLDDVESLPINFCVDGNKVYASIGLNLLSYENEDSYVTNAITKNRAHRLKEDVKFIKGLFAEAKDGMTTAINYDWGKFFKNLKSKYNQQLKYPKGKFLVEGDVKAIGFLEGYINSYGELVLLDSGLIINPEFAVKWSGTFTIPVLPMIPLVWEAAIKGELNARLNLFANKAAKGFIPYGDFDGKVSLSGGVGVGIANVANVTGGIKGTLEPTFEMHRDLSSHFKLDASFGVYAKIQVAQFEYPWDYELARSTWYENPAPQTYRMYALANEEVSMLGDYSDASVYELQNREYLDYYSGFTMNENVAPYALARTFSMRSDVSTDKTTVFYENIYPNAEPVIGTFDDGTMIAVYIGDDTTRTDINRTRLYYSFYNGIEWSQPVPVDANGKTADFAPALVIAQNKAFITWQDATKTFSNSDSLESIAPYFDISIAVFDPTNKNIVTHTIEYKGLDMIPNICANDNNVSVVWVNNALNDWYGCNNANSILAYTYTDNGWGNVVNLKASLASVRSIDAQYIGNVLNTIYSIDTDNNVETVSDINTYLLRNSSNTIIKSNSGVVNSAIIRNGTIYWQENGNIMYCDVNNLSVINSIFSSDVIYSINNYEVLDNGYEKYAIIVIGDGLYSKLGISVFDNLSMTWSDIVYITDGSNMISDYDAVITSDGFVRVIATQTAVQGDMNSSDPYGLSDIIICDVYINGDLKVEDVTFDMSKTVDDTTAEVYAHIVNKGKETIDSSVISIYDRNWNLISTSIDETEIKPGAEATLIAYMDIDETIIGTDVYVVVKPRGINDVNQTDNSIEVTVNYFDVAVEQISYGRNSDGKAVIYANVVNRGYRTENNITAYLRKGSADASVIASTSISSLNEFDSIPVQFSVAYEEGAIYYITISENDGDMMTSNNQDFVVLVDESETPAHLLGDVNLDGQVTADDATNIMEHLAGMLSISNKTSLENADVDKNGLITADDATKIMEYLAGMIGRLE